MYKARKNSESESGYVSYEIYAGEEAGDEYFLVVSDRRRRRIPISMIRYVESCARKLTFYLTTGEVCFYAKLGDIEPVLQRYGFVRTHQSYMVRISEITELNRYCISIDGMQIPVSRRYYKDVTDKIKYRR